MRSETRLDELKAYIEARCWQWQPGKSVAYGEQIVIVAGSDSATVTFYPKNAKLVVGGSPRSELRATLEAWTRGEAQAVIEPARPAASANPSTASSSRLDALKQFIQDQGWHWGPGAAIDYGEQIVVSDAGLTALVNFWPKRGKIDIQGPDSPLKAALRTWVTGEAVVAPATTETPFDGPHIGMDESGKGDWFGPLVVAAVYVDESTAANLRQIGVRDSKELSADAILRIAGQIERTVGPEQRFVLALDPAEYNKRYALHGNINLLLAEAYAEVADHVWRTTQAPAIVCDQFAQNAERLELAFSAANLPRPIQQHRAESASIAVAAASILASAAFAEALVQLGQQAGLGEPMPKGASEVNKLQAAAKQIITMHGAAALSYFAKVNFKPVKALLGDAVPATISDQAGSLLRPGPSVTIKAPAWEEAYHPEGFWVFRFRDGGVLNWYDATTGSLYMTGKPSARSFRLLSDKVKGKKWTKDIEDIRKAIRRFISDTEEVSIPSVLGLGWRRRETVLGGRFDLTDGAVLNYYSGKGTLSIQGKPEPLTEQALKALPSPFTAGWDALNDTMKQLFPDWRLASQLPAENMPAGAPLETGPWSPLDNALDWRRFWPTDRPLRVAPNEKAPCQRALVEDWASVLAGHQGKRHLIAHAPTGLGKTLAALAPALAWVAQAPDRRRIYYLVNRVSQHANPVRELRNGLADLFEHRTGVPLRVVDIVGQSLLCDHPKASAPPAPCRQARDTANFALLPAGVPSWQEVKEQLAGQRCAYHTLQGLMAQAHLVICDYWWLFSRAVQDSGLTVRAGISAIDSIVIVDEAHNLPLRVRAEIDIDEPVDRVAEVVGRAPADVRTCLEPVIAAVQAVDPATGVDVAMLRVLAGGTQAIQSALNTVVSAQNDEPHLTPSERMLRLLLEPEEAVVAYPAQDLDGTARIVLRRVDPTPVLQAGYNRVYASLSMSGTLAAPSDGAEEMRYQVPLFGLPLGQTVARKYASPFPLRNQRWIYSTDTCGTYRERGLHLKRYAEHIVGVGQATPGVTAVFFSSYAFLEQVKAAIRDFDEQALIVTEARADALFVGAAASDLSSYERQLRTLVSQHGRAYLFAICQGKLAEGADFAGNLIKSVVCISVPMEYPVLFHRRLQQAYTSCFAEVAELSGDDSSIKAREYARDRHSLSLVLQGCGRGIRSESDRCAFVLLDKRYHEYGWRRFLEPRPYNVRWSELNVLAFNRTKEWHLRERWDFALTSTLANAE